MADHLKGMHVFTRVVALGGFSAAARELGLSQTMVTKHVNALEERLGAQLLRRTTRRVTPTEAGARYAEAARRILEQIEEVEAEVAAERVEPRGTLRLSAPVSFGVRELAPLLGSYTRRHKALKIELGLNDRLVDIMEEGWDLAIRIAALEDSSLIARRLASCRTLVCAAPAYLAAHGTPRTIADLAGHNCLGYTLSATTRPDRWRFGADGEHVITVSGGFRANNGDATAAAAVAGMGVAFEPVFIIADDLRAGRLVALELDQPPTPLPGVYAVYPATREPSAKIRTMIDYLAAAWAGEPPWEQNLPG